jgi:hypothetical protein
MKYLLSKQEYDELMLRADDNESIRLSPGKLQKLCTKICNEMPVKFWGKSQAEPWRCILSKPNRDYCDECPVQEICPSDEKRYSQ